MFWNDADSSQNFFIKSLEGFLYVNYGRITLKSLLFSLDFIEKCSYKFVRCGYFVYACMLD